MLHFLYKNTIKIKNINFDCRFFMYINWILFFSLKTCVFIKQANHNWFLKVKKKNYYNFRNVKKKFNVKPDSII